MELISSKPVTVAEVFAILEKREKNAPEGKLDYELSLALEHAKKFSKKEPKEAQKLVTEIAKNGKIPLETVIKMVDVLPKNIETLRAIIIKDKVELSEEELNVILKQLQ